MANLRAIVKCPYDGSDYSATDGQAKYTCPKCRNVISIAWANDPRAEEIKQELENMSRQLQANSAAGLPHDSFHRLESLVQSFVSMRPVTEIEIMLERQFYVPYHLSRDLSVVDTESSILVGISSLFFGLFVQEWLNKGNFIGTVIPLFLATIVFMGLTVYFFLRGCFEIANLRRRLTICATEIGAILDLTNSL
jgi:hypothetical protein